MLLTAGLLGALSARAVTPITMDPMVDPLLQGYSTDGTEAYATGARLGIFDSSSLGHLTFYTTVPEIATEDVAVDVTVQVAPGGTSLDGVDTGVRVILGEGTGGFNIAAALIDRGADRRVALVLNGGAFTLGVPFDWSVEGTFRLERNNDPNNRAVLTVPGRTPEVLTDIDLPAAHRSAPSFEFGNSRDAATTTSLWGPIGIQQPPQLAATVQPPINADGSSTFSAKRGNVPLKFSLTENGSPTCDLPAATLRLTRTGGTSPGPIDESVYGGPSDSGGDFRIADCAYHYNISASALGSGTYLAEILIDDAVVGEARFELK